MTAPESSFKNLSQLSFHRTLGASLMEIFGRWQSDVVDGVEGLDGTTFRARTREALEILRPTSRSRASAPIGSACLACVRGGAQLNANISLVVVPSNGRS